MPQASVQKTHVQLQLGSARKKAGIKWWIRGAVGTWVILLILLIRGSYNKARVASLNAQIEDSYQHQRQHRVPSPLSPGETTVRGHKKHDKKPLFVLQRNETSVMSSANEKQSPPTSIVAHAISFLDCGFSLIEKYKDAMLVLRHSIHNNSWHNPNSTSRYSYRMYAFVNSDPNGRCERYAPWIQRMGYTPLLLPNPINLTTINNQFYREQIDRTGVAGSSELIKLYLYTLTDHAIACHWDIDVIVKQPMDDIFDAMLYDPTSKQGMIARSQLQIQQPLHQRIPQQIDAYFTRDIALAVPWRTRQVSQGGFTVVRPNRTVFEHYLQVIHAANFSARCDNFGGWGGLGYGCQQGSMHYQGVVAYYYDHIHPGPGGAVELDVCAWNQIGHSVFFYSEKKQLEEYNGMCRQYPIYGGSLQENRPELGACHDCRVFPVEATRTVHYTACGKPWQCKHTPETNAETGVINATTCGLLHREFFLLRRDLEEKIVSVLGDVFQAKTYEDDNAIYPEFFLGYCKKTKKHPYRAMPGLPESFEMKQLYGF